MDNLIADIERALANKLRIFALVGALALPDVCDAVGSQSAEAGKFKYAQWFTANLGVKYPLLNPHDFYEIRNRMLHQAHSKGRPYARIIFTVPCPRGGCTTTSWTTY